MCEFMISMIAHLGLKNRVWHVLVMTSVAVMWGWKKTLSVPSKTKHYIWHAYTYFLQMSYTCWVLVYWYATSEQCIIMFCDGTQFSQTMGHENSRCSVWLRCLSRSHALSHPKSQVSIAMSQFLVWTNDELCQSQMVRLFFVHYFCIFLRCWHMCITILLIIWVWRRLVIVGFILKVANTLVWLLMLICSCCRLFRTSWW